MHTPDRSAVLQLSHPQVRLDAREPECGQPCVPLACYLAARRWVA